VVGSLISCVADTVLPRARLAELEEYYGAEESNDLDTWERQFNIPSREFAPVVMQKAGIRKLKAALWGILPPWAESRDDSRQLSTFNAKAETIAEKPTFKNAFAKRRCIVPAEAFYEWVGPKGNKIPLHISRKDGKFLSMAGLFNYWTGPEDEKPFPTFTIITTEPNAWMARIHNRRPVILPDNGVEAWLDPRTDAEELSGLLKAPPEDWLDCYPVDAKLVNSGMVDVPECVERTDVQVSHLLKPVSS
jgi:putative SOS response-associated peptidase YedK